MPPTPMPFRFEELKVLQIALQLSNEIDLLSKTFPKIKMFNLCLQIKKLQTRLYSIEQKGAQANQHLSINDFQE